MTDNEVEQSLQVPTLTYQAIIEQHEDLYTAEPKLPELENKAAASASGAAVDGISWRRVLSIGVGWVVVVLLLRNSPKNEQHH